MNEALRKTLEATASLRALGEPGDSPAGSRGERSESQRVPRSEYLQDELACAS